MLSYQVIVNGISCFFIPGKLDYLMFTAFSFHLLWETSMFHYPVFSSSPFCMEDYNFDGFKTAFPDNLPKFSRSLLIFGTSIEPVALLEPIYLKLNRVRA